MLALFLLRRLASVTAASGQIRVTTANDWYEGAEIYYIDHGIEEGVTARGQNDIYSIGGNRLYQAQFVEFVPVARLTALPAQPTPS